MGAIVSKIELDPWGATVSNFSSNDLFQPKKFTSYERDGNGSDEVMFRRYNRWQSRFDQPDPYDGSYSLTNPQSLNRYAYVQGDPVNFVDPSGLIAGPGSCGYYDAESGTFHFAPCPITCSRYEACYGGSNDDGFGGNPSRDGGGDPQNPTITNLVNKTFSNKACQEFMNTILNNASTKGNPVLEGGDIQKIFSDFLAQTKGGDAKLHRRWIIYVDLWLQSGGRVKINP